MKKAKQGAVPVPKKNLWKQIAKHWEFYVLLLPGIILTIIFKTFARKRFDSVAKKWGCTRPLDDRPYAQKHDIKCE